MITAEQIEKLAARKGVKSIQNFLGTLGGYKLSFTRWSEQTMTEQVNERRSP